MSFPEREGGPSGWTVDGFLHRPYDLCCPSRDGCDEQEQPSPGEKGRGTSRKAGGGFLHSRHPDRWVHSRSRRTLASFCFFCYNRNDRGGAPWIGIHFQRGSPCAGLRGYHSTDRQNWLLPAFSAVVGTHTMFIATLKGLVLPVQKGVEFLLWKANSKKSCVWSFWP